MTIFSSHQSAVKHPSNALAQFQTQLKKASTHCACMRHTKIWAKFHHAVSAMKVPRQDARRKRKHCQLQLFVVVFGIPFHRQNIAYLRYFGNSKCAGVTRDLTSALSGSQQAQRSCLVLLNVRDKQPFRRRLAHEAQTRQFFAFRPFICQYAAQWI